MRVLAVVVLAVVLASCSAGGSEPERTPTSEPTSSAPSESPGPNLPGEPANADLTGFACERDAKGAWNAAGTLTSPSGTSDYRVTVLVAPAGTDRSKARRQIIANVRKDEPKEFEVADVPADADGGTCRVQVVRLG